MSRIFAPEGRGNIRRRLALPASGSGRIVLTLFLLALAFAFPLTPAPAIAEKRQVFSRIASGSCAAMFALPDLDGHARMLAAERGRPVVVHFFATWCEPCKAELASLQQLFATRGNGLGVLAVNVGEVPGRVRSFLKETPVSFPVLLDADRAVTKTWAVDGLPTSVVLNKRLEPILAVSRDLDWTGSDVGAEIEAALASEPNSANADCAREDNR